MSFDELWDALVRFAEVEEDEEFDAEDESDGDGDGESDGHHEGSDDNEDDAADAEADDDMDGNSRLIETLIRRFPEAACERAIGVVRAIPPGGETGWMDDYCVDMLGRTKNYAAVPLLLEQLGTCDDLIQSSITHALGTARQC